MAFRHGVLIVSFLACGFGAFAQDAIRGFGGAQLADELKWEDKARAVPDAARIARYMETLSRKPHLAGTPNSKKTADTILEMLKSWGLDGHIEEYEALLPQPKVRVLETVGPKPFRAKLVEPPMAADPTSFDKDEAPTYNAYSGSGDVTAPLVYVNYGMPGDYEYLTKNGVDVKGAIVISRYGGGWRGLKPRLAAEHGAVGCLIYSDPHEDGYFRGDVYTKGMWRPPDGVQRGSVMDMTLYPGDPLSPGWASEKGGRLLPISEAHTLMKIPVLPLSYGDAEPLLRGLSGLVAPDDWRGALGITYHIGNGGEKVHLHVEMDNSIHPVYDVIGQIHGGEDPGEWVMAGNHHDAWVHGAMDPLSGASALLETARTLGALSKEGWRPRRTIVFAFWDAEEFGLVGSTEYAEKHAAELTKNLVAYINSDTTSKGQLGVGGSHTLESFVVELARDVQDPVSHKPLSENLRLHSSGQTAIAGEGANHGAHETWHMEALGSGSDYTVFLQHLGIACLNFGFGDENGTGGIYHSAYDSYYWYTHFADTNFAYGKTLSTLTSMALMRLSGAALEPFQFTQLANALTRYDEELQKLGAADKKVDLSELKSQVDALRISAEAFEAAYQQAMPKLAQAPEAKLEQVNELLFGTERAMLLPAGLPGRPWFRHSIYAPGSLTGYGAKTLPGIREALEGGRVDEARREATEAESALGKVTQDVQEATRVLAGL